MTNLNIFKLEFTATHQTVTCKECGEQVPMPIISLARDVENVFRDFRKEHEELHGYYYDPGKVSRTRKRRS